MEAIFVPLFLIAIAGIIGGSIVWSIWRGLVLLRGTYHHAGPHIQARRLLAWNLIEPGITVPNLIIVWLIDYDWINAMINWLGISLQISRRAWHPTDLLAPFVGLWPMVLLLVIFPLWGRMSSDPTLRWAAQKTVKLGAARFIVTVLTFATSGLAIVVGFPLLLWSLKRIRLWSEELHHERDHHPVAAIVGGKDGMRVLASNQYQGSHFKALLVPPGDVADQ